MTLISEESFTCDKCGKSFKMNWYAPMNDQQTEALKKRKCPYCGEAGSFKFTEQENVPDSDTKPSNQ